VPTAWPRSVKKTRSGPANRAIAAPVPLGESFAPQNNVRVDGQLHPRRGTESGRHWQLASSTARLTAPRRWARTLIPCWGDALPRRRRSPVRFAARRNYAKRQIRAQQQPPRTWSVIRRAAAILRAFSKDREAKPPTARKPEGKMEIL
jgi:hypothetical protein